MELGGCRWNTPCQLTAVRAASPAGAGGPGAGRAGRCPARRGGGGVLSPSAVGVAAPRVAELPHLSHPRQRGPRCGGRSVANKHVKSGLGHSVTCSRVCGGGLAPPPPPPVSSALGAALATGAGPCRGGRAGSCHLLPGVVSGPLALGREAPPWPKTLAGGAWLAHGFVQGAVCPADRLPDGLRSTVLACSWVLGQGQCGESYPDMCAFGAMRFCQVRLLVGVNKEDEQPADTTLISCKLSILYGAGSMGVA